MVLPMIGMEYLGKMTGQMTGKLKKLTRPLLKDGIGDKMDKGNLWLVPGFTMFAFAVLWTIKLSKLALDESTCKKFFWGASIYDFAGQQIDEDAKRHCQTANRYFVDINEAFSHDQKWRLQRQVKNPEWVIWFWAPIVFVMYVLTRFIWSLLLENQGINFPNVVNACTSVVVENDEITQVDEDKLYERLAVISDNFRCASSSHAFAAFVAFEIALVLAPLFLLVFFLPLMIGSGFRTWGLDIARAWWEQNEWKGVPLQPLLGSSHSHSVKVPLIPRVTYCDYHFVSLGNDHVLTYRCYLDANWHERTALFTWYMLVFLSFINLCNLFFWVEWAFRMRSGKKRQSWVLKKWLNADDFCPGEKELMKVYAAQFKMGNLLFFYYIEAHTDRVVASAFCTALFRKWLEKEQMPDNRLGWAIGPNAMDPRMRLGSLPYPTAPSRTPTSKDSFQVEKMPVAFSIPDRPPSPERPLSANAPSSSIGISYSSATTAKEQGIAMEEDEPKDENVASSTYPVPSNTQLRKSSTSSSRCSSKLRRENLNDSFRRNKSKPQTSNLAKNSASNPEISESE
uniref:Innexin n=1 Tax=Ditylenchus dipsaci TaxID=166011 RepID=A0A915D6J5_9BILA